MHDIVIPTQPYLSVDFRGADRMGRYARRCHIDQAISVCRFQECGQDGAVCTMFSCCPCHICLLVGFRGVGRMGRYARCSHAVPAISVCLWISGVLAGWGGMHDVVIPTRPDLFVCGFGLNKVYLHS